MNNLFWLAVKNLVGVGDVTIKNLYIKNPFMSEDQLFDVLKEKKKIIDREEWEVAIKKAKDNMKDCKEHNVKIITIADEYYPQHLKLINNPPAVLYAKGNIELLKKGNMIAIVGTRKPTKTGILAARKIASTFAEKGYVIVSGLALGIDTAGHKGALRVESGKTIAVLPTGFKDIYPEANRLLAKEILDKSGLLISENYVGKGNLTANLVNRDRIQSGLSLGVCPVQTPLKSGTQHTIKFAKEQDRCLFVPIPIQNELHENAVQGNIELINNGVLALENKDSYPKIIAALEEVKGKLKEQYLKQVKSNTSEESNKKKEIETINQLKLF